MDDGVRSNYLSILYLYVTLVVLSVLKQNGY